MSIGNLKDYGNKGNNFPWQLKMLIGQQCACDQLQLATSILQDIDDNTDQVEPLLVQILTAIQQGTDYEAALVVDASNVTWLEIRVWNTGTGTFDPPVYYLAGSNTPGTPTAPITYINPNTYLAQIVSYTSNLVSIEAGTPNALGQTTMVNSMPVVIASNQTALPASQSGTWNLNNITGTVSLPTGAATEVTTALINSNTVLGNITLNSIDTKLTSAVRTPGIRTYVNVTGSTLAGLYSFSIANVGSASGLVDGEVLPAGVTINFDGGALNNTLGAMNFDATGTTFVVTFIS
jgi:hypothetical protein